MKTPIPLPKTFPQVFVVFVLFFCSAHRRIIEIWSHLVSYHVPEATNEEALQYFDRVIQHAQAGQTQHNTRVLHVNEPTLVYAGDGVDSLNPASNAARLRMMLNCGCA